LEGGAGARGNGIAADELDTLGIHRPTIDAELVVEMGPGGEAGHPDVADHVTLLDPHAAMDAAREGAQVAVAGGVAVLVAQLDQVPVAVRLSRRGDDRVADGVDGGARRRRVIDPVVGAVDAEERVMAAAGEDGADAAVLEGSAQEGALEGAAVALV